MDRSVDEHVSDLTSQVAELRSVNAELGRALAAADAGTPLRSSITAALMLSRVEDAERAAAADRTEREAAIAERDAAMAERDAARTARDAAIAERDQTAGALEEIRRLHAEQVAEASRLSNELTVERSATQVALRECAMARASLESASTELERREIMLSRRSVRTAQRAARAAGPLFETARRLRRKA
jgi:hypothetical protein